MNSYCQSIELQPFVMGFQNWVVVDVLSKTWSFQATQAVFTPQQLPCNGNLQMVATREVMKWILNRRYLFAASQKNKKKQIIKHKNKNTKAYQIHSKMKGIRISPVVFSCYFFWGWWLSTYTMATTVSFSRATRPGAIVNGNLVCILRDVSSTPLKTNMSPKNALF